MKKIIITLIISFIWLPGQAQSQELFDNEWFLAMISIEGEEYITPSSDTHTVTGEVTSISYSTLLTGFGDYGVIETAGCNWYDISYEDMDDDSFTVVGVSTTLMDCMYPLYLAHDNRMYEFFGAGPDEDFPWEGFTYEIIPKPDETKTLIITNPDGNTAFYNNAYLSTSEVSKPENNFKIAFQNDDLIIKNSLVLANSIMIYNFKGQTVLPSTAVLNNRVKTSGLSKGIYIVKIKDMEGTVFTKKVRKE